MNKLSKELPGILNWAIQGCLEWQKQGLNPPQIILDQVKAYKTELAFLVEWIDKFLSTQLACPAHVYNWSDP